MKTNQLKFKEITSIANPMIKSIMLLEDKKHIIKSNMCFVEGEKIVFELLLGNASLKFLLVEFSKKDIVINYINQKLHSKQIEIVLINSQVANKISQTKTHGGIFAVFELPKQKNFDNSDNFLVLDSVQDSTNLGAIVRSALAFGIKQIVSINSVYEFLPKSIRSSSGYVFNINFISMNLNEFISFSNQTKLNLIGAKMQGENIKNVKNIDKPFGLIMGNEGKGINVELESLCNKFVAIEMQNNVESLNVAVSSSIILYELTK